MDKRTTPDIIEALRQYLKREPTEDDIAQFWRDVEAITPEQSAAMQRALMRIEERRRGNP